MGVRQTPRFRPAVEPLEVKRPLSGAAAAAHHAARPQAAAAAAAPAPAAGEAPAAPEVAGTLRKAGANHQVSAAAVKPSFGYLVYRITNPNPVPYRLIPPFGGHVDVQSRPPVPGKSYNVLFISLRNLSPKTFTASDGLGVKLSEQHGDFLPILTGDQQWKPGQVFIFYVLSKKYYPLRNKVTSGFEFNLGGAKSTAIPGPSGIFLRLKYNPATIDRTLDWIAAFGPGAEGGSGLKTGIADTSIYAFVSSKERRNDFGGYF